jgi:hypothetical protein
LRQASESNRRRDHGKKYHAKHALDFMAIAAQQM